MQHSKESDQFVEKEKPEEKWKIQKVSEETSVKGASPVKWLTR
jgi:hypothetical protein